MRGARGFTLVESLVALVVLSVGLLGAAAMLFETLDIQADAARQLAATNLVRDLADRIRANPAGGAHYDTRVPPAPPGSCDAATECDAAQLAAADVAHFRAAAAARFPRADVSADILFVPATGPATPDRFVISLAIGARSAPSALQVVALPPVAG